MPSPDERSIGDDDGDDFPLPEGSFSGRTAPQNPRLVPPRFRLMAAEFHPRRWLMIFFLIERLHIAEDGHRRAPMGPMRQGHAEGGRARPPPSWAGCGPPGELLALSIFYIF